MLVLIFAWFVCFRPCMDSNDGPDAPPASGWLCITSPDHVTDWPRDRPTGTNSEHGYNLCTPHYNGPTENPWFSVVKLELMNPHMFSRSNLTICRGEPVPVNIWTSVLWLHGPSLFMQHWKPMHNLTYRHYTPSQIPSRHTHSIHTIHDHTGWDLNQDSPFPYWWHHNLWIQHPHSSNKHRYLTYSKQVHC